MNSVLNISAGPHIRDKWTTRSVMLTVALSLLPTAVLGVIFHGIHSLWIILASVGSAVLSEFIFDKICRKTDTWKDCSAIITGLLLALTLSPTVPLYIPIAGSAFAIIVVKCFFGGLGKNFLNPALAGRCFLLLSFGKVMTIFPVDSVTGATPTADLIAGNPVNVMNMFLGNIPGVIGTSVIAMLIGGLFLWCLDIIHGQICFSILAGFTVMIGLFGGKGFDPVFLMAHLCGGGVVMGAFFFATDYVTSPVSRLGQTVYGVLIGVLGAVFRLFGNSADSFSYSVIVGNLFVPLIDTYIVPKPFAYHKRMIAARSGKEKLPLLQRIPRPVIALTVITLAAGIALSGVFTVTEDPIEKQRAERKLASYRTVCPGAVRFDTECADVIEALNGGEYNSAFERVRINDAARGVDADENTVGYVISVTSGKGYSGNVTLSLGIAPDDSIIGIAFTELKETPGKGMEADTPEFKGQFGGKKQGFLRLTKSGAVEPDEVDAISGSTVTSKAVVNAVNAGLDFYYRNLKGGEEQ